MAPDVKLFTNGASLFANTVKMLSDVGLAALVGGTTRDGFVATLAGFAETREGFAPACVGDVKTVGGETTAGPSSALSQSAAVSAGTLSGVTGRRL